MKGCAIIIPIYRDTLNEVDKFSMNNNISKLRNHDIYLVMPKMLELNNLNEYTRLRKARFDDDYFKGYRGYNRLMMSEDFYQTFEDYEKILICQYDSWVFEDRLEYFCNLPYDYIGAPNFIYFYEDGNYEVQPGNGGFSLRDIKSTLRLLKAHANERDEWKDVEDRFFSVCAMKYPNEFSMAPLSVCVSFAFDRFVSTMFEWNKQRIPFGIHAWQTYDPNFVCRFMLKEAKCLPDVVKNAKSKEEVMKSFYGFLSRNSLVILYGAGDWGKTIGRALQTLNVNIRCYAISDGHKKTGQEIFGIPICYWSEITTISEDTGVILCMSQRYLNENESNNLHKIVRVSNIYDILNVDYQLYSFIAEIILERGWEVV